MGIPTIAVTPTTGFNDCNISWRKLGELEHLVYNVFAVDEAREIADFIVKFAPVERIFLHRHRSATNTFVVQGEHRLYEPDGGVKEIRPVGSYTCSEPSEDPHSEGGGTEGAVVFYSTRGSANGVLFDVLDDSANQVGTLTLQDVAALFEAQGRKAGG